MQQYVPLLNSQRTLRLQSTTSKPAGLTTDLQKLLLSEDGKAVPANHFLAQLSQEAHGGPSSTHLDLVLVKEG